jgi:uncharacterized repeat protein (TIGR04138 family)
MATDESLRRRLHLLTQRAPHYPLEAYLFVQQAVALTQRRAAHAGGARHVTGQELLEGIRLLALEEFGPFARIVFHEWGITTTRDFGQIVFHMIEQHLLGARKSDSLADFEPGYDFAATFEHPFLPSGQAPTLPCLDRP